MQTDSTSASTIRTSKREAEILFGWSTWVNSDGERRCFSCEQVIPVGDSHVAFGPRFLVHMCEECASGYAVTCPACGEETEEGTCWNQRCPEGFANIQEEMGDAQYHSGVDREVEDYYLEMDR